MERLKCTVVNLDAWYMGDGEWDINDWSFEGVVEFNQIDGNWEYNCNQIINALIEEGYLKANITINDVVIEDGWENTIRVLRYNNAEPLYTLRIENEWEVPDPLDT